MFERIIVGVDEHGGGGGRDRAGPEIPCPGGEFTWRMSSRTMATDTAAPARPTRRPGGSAPRRCSRRFGRTLASTRT